MASLASLASLAFQSTLSVRRATDAHVGKHDGLDISIHALRKESDPTVLTATVELFDFNPRSP